MAESPRTDTSSRWATVTLLVACAAFVALALVLVPIPMLYWYDDGVYYQSGVRMAEGDRPYADFYLAHPPAIGWLAAGAERTGLGILGCRAISFLIGLGLLVGVDAFVRRLIDHPQARPAGLLACLFLASTLMYVEAMSEVMTHLPGMVLTLAGFFALTATRPRPVVAGLLLAVASLFRIQAAYIAPAWMLYILTTEGWSAGKKPALLLAISAGAFAAVFHGILAAIYPNYLDCVLRSHLTRTSTPFREKVVVLLDMFREPQVAFGLMASALLSFSGSTKVRGIAVFALSEIVITIFGSRFLADGYFLPVYPYLFACASVLIAREAERVRSTWPLYATIAAVILFCCGLPLVRMTVYRVTKQRAFERDLIARVRSAPGELVLCTLGKVPLFAGKRMIKDYHTPDTTSPLKRDFGTWFVATAERADVIVLTDEAMKRLTPEECRALLKLGKSLVFGTEEDEKEFERRSKPQSS